MDRDPSRTKRRDPALARSGAIRADAVQAAGGRRAGSLVGDELAVVALGRSCARRRAALGVERVDG